MDARSDEPERGYEERGGRWIELGLGAASIMVPSHWPVDYHELSELHLEVPELPRSKVEVFLYSYESPKTVASCDPDAMLGLPNGPPIPDSLIRAARDEDGRIDFDRLTVRFGATRPDSDVPGAPPRQIDFWRKANLVPPGHWRVIEVMLDTPGEMPDEDCRRAVARTLAKCTHVTRFATDLTAFDRVAPADGLKQVTLWGSAHFRVPEHWELQDETDETGRYSKIDDPDREMWTLWIRRARLPSPAPTKMPDRAARRQAMAEITGKVVGEMLELYREMEETISAERLPAADPYSPPGMKRLWTSIDTNDGELLLHAAWHRLAWIGDELFDVYFEWVIVERVAEEPEMRRLSALVEHEVMQAVIALPDPAAT